MSTNETVRARPISFAEVAELAHKDANPLEAYQVNVTLRHGLTLTPVTLTPKPVGSMVRSGEDYPHHVMYRPVPKPGGMGLHTVDRDHPVGHEVDLTAVSHFDAQSRVTLFTSEAAERTAELVHGVDEPERGRRAIYVRDEAGEEMRLTPVYGSQLTIGVVVKDVPPEEVARRAEAALQAEFGDAMGSVRKVTSRPAEDLRVNVFTTIDKEEVLAVNVLAAETSYVASGKPYVEEVDPAATPAEVN